MRTGKELLIASKDFATEHRLLSWWYLWSTLCLLCLLLLIAASPVHLIARVFASLLSGFVCVRMFIIFHDYQHRAILRNSKIAGLIFWFYGILVLSPPSVWNRSHSDHHKNNSKNFGFNVGSFPIMTKESFQSASLREQFIYLVSRHPLTILFGYLTIFAWGMTLRPLLRDPFHHIDSGIAILVHLILIVSLYSILGPTTLLLAMLLPIFVATLIGGYLFYAQHNFPSAKLHSEPNWSHVDAALESSSYMEMGPLLHWFTGNIGFHHVHHMNALIPFYRLPEAMEALTELRSPGVTSLRLCDIRACLRLKVWDPTAQRLVGLNE
ncbi:MAG: fatty acid desaturase family protein [Aureliella sp.]